MATDHTALNPSVWELVHKTRLTFITVNSANEEISSLLTLELMHELEPCFRVGATDASLVGNEANYNVTQKSILADLVAYTMLAGIMAENTSGQLEAQGKFLSKAVAGSVEVEWEQTDIKKTTALLDSGPGILEKLKKAALRKAHSIGCIIDICDDCSIAVQLDQESKTPMPFIVVSGCDSCGC